MGHARRPGHGAFPAPPAPGDPLPPPDPAAWWLASPSGPPRAPSTARAPSDPAAWWLAPPGCPPRAPAAMCPAPPGDPPPPRAPATTCFARAPAHPGGPPAPPDAATRWRMEDYNVNLNEASFSLFGEQPHQAQQDSPPHTQFLSTGSSGVAMPPCGRRVAGTRIKHTNFSVQEDNLLCKSWLEISCDPITNTGQRKESFWLRVLNRYNSQRMNFPERSQKSIMSRWDFIKAEMSKFSGYMAAAIRSNRSGMSDSDKSVAAAAYFADIEKRNFSLMHCWNILKDEPKWIELKRRMDDKPQSSSAGDAATQDSNSSTMPIDLEVSPPSSSTRKRPMGRDAAKAERKKAKSASLDYATKMHELSIEKVSLFKESEAERKVRLDEMVNIEKVKLEEAREHRKVMIDLEKERLELDKKRLQIEAEKKEKEEDERILAIKLDECQPYERIYYEELQKEIIEKLTARRRNRSQ